MRSARATTADETVYGDDPVAQALAFADAGARWVHVVDLDAARTGDPVNRPMIAAVAAALADRGVRVQTGGGVRSVADARALAAAGVARVVLGTAAVEDPDLVDAVAAALPGLGSPSGLDVRGARSPCAGWTEGRPATSTTCWPAFAEPASTPSSSPRSPSTAPATGPTSTLYRRAARAAAGGERSSPAAASASLADLRGAAAERTASPA